MATVVNTLYPPAIASQMPAFIYNDAATVYFSISSYDKPDDIAYIHVSVTDQRTNKNVLIGHNETSDFYPAIIPYMLNTSSEYQCAVKVSDRAYKITIPSSAIKGGFLPNQFYKVQIRFQLKSDDSSTGSDNPCKYFNLLQSSTPGNNQLLNGLLNKYKPYFSEWSTVCLIRPIYSPEIFYTDQSSGISKFSLDSSGNPPSFPPGEIRISGYLDFYKTKSGDSVYDMADRSNEKLKSYKISVVANRGVNDTSRVSELPDDTVFISGEEVFTSYGIDQNEINTTIDIRNLKVEKAYVKITITTTNNYTFSRYYAFSVNIDSEDTPWIITPIIDDENGTIILNLDPSENNTDDTQFGFLHIWRSSSFSDFSDWEEIAVYKLDADIKNIQHIDNTVGSLIGYKYSIQYENTKGLFYRMKESSILMLDFYGALLSRGNKTLKISFDFNASQLTPTVNRAVFNTLGGKYPKFAENAVMNYKKYSITGKISSQNDDNSIIYSPLKDKNRNINNDLYELLKDNAQYNEISTFLTKQDIIGKQFYDYYYEKKGQQDNNIHGSNSDSHKEDEYKKWEQTLQYDDYMWEREYREQVIKWLNDGEPKLFRTMTEGNLAVMLTDISLTPTNSLSRRLWDFSATMYEIEDGNSIEILDALGIYNIKDETFEDLTNINSSEDEETMSSSIYYIGQSFEYSNSDSTLCEFLKEKISGTFRGIKEDRYLSKSAGNLYLQKVKIQFLNKPHIFIKEDGRYRVASENDMEDENIREKLIDSFYGYYIKVTFYNDSNPENPYITDQEFWINDKGYIQFPAELKIADISFPYMNEELCLDGHVDNTIIDYVVHYKEVVNNSKVKSNTYTVRSLVGQESGKYNSGESIGTNIFKRYTFTEYAGNSNTGTTKIISVQKMNYWKGISLETEPYTTVELIYADNTLDNISDNERNKYVTVGETGILSFNKQIEIADIIAIGRRMTLSSDFNFMREHEYYKYIGEESFNSINEIEYPQNNWVYTSNGKEYIYHEGHFYDFERMDNDAEEIGIAKIPINVILNYSGSITKSVYGNE